MTWPGIHPKHAQTSGRLKKLNTYQRLTLVGTSYSQT